MYNPLAQSAQEKIASSSLANTCIYPASVCQVEDTLIFLVNQNYKKLLVLLSPTDGVSKKFTELYSPSPLQWHLGAKPSPLVLAIDWAEHQLGIYEF